MDTRSLLRARPIPSLVAALTLALAVESIPAEAETPAEPAPAEESESESWEVDTDHGPSTRLEFETTEGTWISLDVSGDGSSLAFDLLGHIYEMPLSGGEAQPLTTGRSWNMLPRYCPDGQRLAFTSDRSGSNDLWVLHRDTGDLENVSEMDLPVFHGTWDPTGRTLFGTALNMKVRFPAYAFNGYGGKQEIVAAGGRSPVNHFSAHPTEPWVYFNRGARDVYRGGPRIDRYDLTSGEIETYLSRPGGASNPTFSPDGRRMAYVHRHDHETVLVLHDLETQEERVLMRGLDPARFESGTFYGFHPNFAWHPDGSSIFISRGGAIVRVDAAGGEITPVPFRATVSRLVDETLRFPVEVPDRRARTRSHRWAQRFPGGVLFEALGDLQVLDAAGVRALTDTPEHETCPRFDPATGLIYYATWSDESLGKVCSLDWKRGKRKILSQGPAQFGSLAISPKKGELAFLRSSGGLARGTHLEHERHFDLMLRKPKGRETVLRRIHWTGNRYGKRPPALRFSPNGKWIYFSEYRNDTLELRRIRRTGTQLETLYEFPHATRAIVSPDLRWIAFREYHRTFVTPFEFLGKTLKTSAADGDGTALRVDSEDGDFTEWSPDGHSLLWTRGSGLYEKKLSEVVAEGDDHDRTELSFEYDLAVPDSKIALTHVRVVTMNDMDEVLEDATILVEGNRIISVGNDVSIPAEAHVVDLSGHTVMPGMFDAHGHYGSPISALNVIESGLYGLRANLAYGVTTMYDVYGTTQKDFWVSDMLRQGSIDGPRIFSVGDPIFVTQYRSKMYRPITSLDDAREQVSFNHDHGARAVKDYSNHTRAARQQLAQACRELQVNLVTESFANPQMNLTQIIDGFTGIEHTLGLAPLYSDVTRLFTHSQVGMTPTLIVVYNGPSGEGWFHQRERLWEDAKLRHFFREDELLRYRRPTFHWDDDHYAAVMAEEMLGLHRAGVPLHMGAHGNMMGLGAHWEMELFAHGGFEPHEILRIATINGFRHHGLDHALGSVEEKKFADLVVLRMNPLEDIRNTRTIRYVMKNGVLHDGETADRVWPPAEPLAPLYFHEDAREPGARTES